jgi:hypothetical protein
MSATCPPGSTEPVAEPFFQMLRGDDPVNALGQVYAVVAGAWCGISAVGG